MIPYIHIPTIQLGPLILHTWGLFVSLGFVVGILLAYQRAKKQNLEAVKILDLAFWVILAALVGARVFHAVFYEWNFYSVRPIEIFKIWEGGMSSFGGFFGAALAGILYLRRHKIDVIKYSDVILYALPLGWALGRLGCFFSHLHQGIKSNLFFAVNFPDGSRLEMSVLESFFAFLLFCVFAFLGRRQRQKGFFTVSFLLAYGVLRFILDFFRAADIASADVRYFSLTPAQYGSLIFILLAGYLRFKLRRCII